jgi:hypothetical protein
MSRDPGLSPRFNPTKAFPVLFVVAWACVAAVVKWDARWLYLLLGLTVIAGLCLSRGQPLLLRALLLLALAFPAWKKIDRWRHRVASGQNAAVSTEDARVISALVAGEETYLALSPKMSALSNGLLNLRLPDPAAEAVFAPSVSVSDVDPAGDITATSEGMLQSHTWPVSKDTKDVTTVDLWRPLLDIVSRFEHANVHIVSGQHPNGDMLRYEAQSRFDALAQMKSGEWRSLNGKINVIWKRPKERDGKVGEWQITGWKTEEMQWIASPKRLFVEALDKVVRAPAEVALLRRSEHYEATVKYYRDGMKTLPHPYFSPISVNHKEDVTVADIDGDGFDDIYITVRIGKNMLLHNHGDGTFTEEGARYGLDLPGHTTCAIFADFDNDGDLDAMLGRSLLKTTYLENKGGRFYHLSRRCSSQREPRGRRGPSRGRRLRLAG